MIDDVQAGPELPFPEQPEADGRHAELLKELWEAAVNLRGTIEPGDYKRYALPIVFLRFLSLRFHRRRAELERMIREPDSPYYGDDAVLEDEDEYRAASAFMVPPEARWEHIRSNAQADDVKIILDDAFEALERAYPDRLRGLLPRIFASSPIARENVAGLINLFSRDVFEADHGGMDLIGRVYEYFIGGFADSEGKRGGEYFTPLSIVRTLVAMLEPEEGVVYDPCCGSGGMFVQSDVFTGHSKRLSFVGQESKEFTYRLARMNLFIHGLDGDIERGNTYVNDAHADVRARYVIANPPFNDGSKSREGWGADRIPDKDPRRVVDGERMPLSPRNANTMWILHFLYHLDEEGTAGFVMATGELSNMENARAAVRKALVDHGYVDCIVQLTGQLFANTQIPCSLWFLSKNRKGMGGFRERKDEILFVDGRSLGSLIPGSRTQKYLSRQEIERISSVYRTFRREERPEAEPGFAAVASVDEVRKHNYALTPGRYVDAEEIEKDGEPFEDRFPKLVARYREQQAEAAELEGHISSWLDQIAEGMSV